MSPTYRWVIRWARTVHLYATLFGLALLLLFSITGFMLNHRGWFVSSDIDPVESEATLPTEMLREPDRLAIVEYLRKHHGATGALDLFEPPGDAASIRVTFKQPGRYFEAEIDQETGATKMKSLSEGFNGVVMALHQGKDSGWIWALVIDFVAVLMLVISITGLILWWSLKGRGHWPGVTLVLGVVALVVVYVYCIP